jgi:hypothetical protein
MDEQRLRVAFVGQDGQVFEASEVSNKKLADGISDLSDELLKRVEPNKEMMSLLSI